MYRLPALMQKYYPVSILINTSLSVAVDLQDYRAVGLVMSAAWDAADITLQSSYDGTNYAVVYDPYLAATKIRFKVAATYQLLFPPGDLCGLRWVKLQSESAAGVAVNQTAARTLYLITQPLAI